jgi:hypothetical protein
MTCKELGPFKSTNPADVLRELRQTKRNTVGVLAWNGDFPKTTDATHA